MTAAAWKWLGTAGRSVIAAGLALVAVGASGVSAQPAQDWDALVAAAKKEGKIVLYNGTSLNIAQAVSKAFEAKYGISVDAVNATPSAIRERVRTELANGRTIGDVRLAGVSSGVPEIALGFYQPPGALPNIGKAKNGYRDTTGTLVPATVGRFTILVNTSMLSEAEQPKSWHDLLDPKWKGKIISTDPRTGGSGLTNYSVWYERFGKEFIDKLAAQNVTMGSDIRLMERQVARGEYPIHIPFTSSDLITLEGLPVKAVIPTDGEPTITTAMGLLKDAPHPNAGRLFMNFWLEDEAQKIISTFGSDNPTGIVSETTPAYMRPILAAPTIGEPDPLKLDEMQKMFAGIFK
jgi:iron(III) transport system substrate-binding protein